MEIYNSRMGGLRDIILEDSTDIRYGDYCKIYPRSN